MPTGERGTALVASDQAAYFLRRENDRYLLAGDDGRQDTDAADLSKKNDPPG